MVKDRSCWLRGRSVSLAGVILVENKEGKVPPYLNEVILYSDKPDLKGKPQDKFIKLWVWANDSDLHLGT